MYLTARAFNVYLMLSCMHVLVSTHAKVLADLFFIILQESWLTVSSSNCCRILFAPVCTPVRVASYGWPISFIIPHQHLLFSYMDAFKILSSQKKGGQKGCLPTQLPIFFLTLNGILSCFKFEKSGYSI